MRTVAPQRYLQRIGEHLRNAPSDAEYPRSVFATFSTSVAQAEYQAAGACAVLCFAASFAPDAIPDELFRQPIRSLSGGATARNTWKRRSALDLRSQRLSTISRLDACLSALDRLSLLAFSTTSRTYSLHRLVQFAARDLAVSHAVGWRECAVGVVDAVFPEVEFPTWPQCERVLAHARAALDELPRDTELVSAANLANRCGNYLMRKHGEYAEAAPLVMRSLTLRERLLRGCGPSPDVGGNA